MADSEYTDSEYDGPVFRASLTVRVLLTTSEYN